MRVSLRFIKSNPWAGIVKYKNCFDYLGPYITRSGGTYTGLTKEDQARLEKELGYDPGFLSSTSNFWITFAIKIPGGGYIIDTDNPYGELQYLFAKNHKRVAQGYSNIHPNNDYVLVDEEAEAKADNLRNKSRREAIKAFDKMSIEDMRKCLRIWGFKSDTISNELVESKLFDLVEKNPSKFHDLWINNKDKDIEFILESAVSKNVLRKQRSTYYYGTDVIGSTKEDAIAYINDKNNSDFKKALLSEINSK